MLLPGYYHIEATLPSVLLSAPCHEEATELILRLSQVRWSTWLLSSIQSCWNHLWRFLPPARSRPLADALDDLICTFVSCNLDIPLDSSVVQDILSAFCLKEASMSFIRLLSLLCTFSPGHWPSKYWHSPILMFP